MKIVAFFQLVRWKNLGIIFIMQFLISGVLLQKFDLAHNFPSTVFLLVSLSTICIAASGYIINDIIDVAADLINKKEKVIVGNVITKKSAKTLYILSSITGIILGSLAALQISKPHYIFIFIIFALLLFLYSYSFKSKALLGNLLVAFLVSCTILIIGIFEAKSSKNVFNIIIIYSLFAFTVNLLREIIKDVEDIEGDKSMGLRTLPILMGRQRTNRVALGISVVFVSSIVFVLSMIEELSNITRMYGYICIVIPTALLISKLYSSKTKKEYATLSSLLKIIMLLGMGSIFTL